LKQMAGKICLVTGASSGIGKVTALELAKMGATVVMVSRDQQRGEKALSEVKTVSGNENVELVLTDLSSQKSIRELVEHFKEKYKRLDLLMNNAGVMVKDRRLTEDGIESTFAINHLAYFLLTNLLLDVIKESSPARIINVTSNGHKVGAMDLDNLNAEKSYNDQLIYCQSKLANVLFTYELARKLVGTGVTVNCLHPGIVKSNFGRDGSMFYRFLLTTVLRPFMISPETGAETSIYLATSPEVEEVSGKYFVKKKAVKSSKKTYDLELAQKLWEISAKMTQLS
jgi:NAD(P)-dependent dehydrogenase (short-subunit alcohol dehydrogenase family)